MSYSDFQQQIPALTVEACHEIYRGHKDCIRIKKEAVAVARLGAVVEKTLEISNRIGFQAMSVRDLSEATDISMGALYSYIESKERLLELILLQGRLIARRVLTEPPGLGGARARLRWLLRTHLYLTEAMQPWFYFAYMESRYFGRETLERAIDAEQSTEQLIVQLLRDGIAEGVFHSEQPELVAVAIKPLLQDWYLKRWKFRRRGLSVDDYADFLIDFIETALRVPDRAPAGAR